MEFRNFECSEFATKKRNEHEKRNFESRGDEGKFDCLSSGVSESGRSSPVKVVSEP